jgi:uncharacterized protein DUF2510
MSSTDTPPGWHPDPENPTLSMRWWDGTQWTSDVRPIPARTTPPPLDQAYPPPGAGGYGPGGPYGSQGYGHPHRPFGGSGMQMGQATFARRNQRSLTAAGVAALYIIIAITTRIVLFGIFPLILSVRAWQARETLAPLAIAVTVVAIIVGFTALAAH